MQLKKMITIFASTCILFAPLVTLAYPFGGQIGTIVYPCYNQVIWARLGPPNGGDFIWTAATRTYQFGPPTHTGQWLLGLSGVPYNCRVSINPIIVWEGTTIAMMGSSGPAAPSFAGGGYTQPNTSAGGGSGTTASGGSGSGSGGGSNGTTPTPVKPPISLPPSPPGTPSINHVVISEVYYSVDSGHGSDPQHEWVELYNGSSVGADVSGWTISDSALTRTIPQSVTIAPNSFYVITADVATKNKWNIPAGIPVISLNALIGDGLASSGDRLVLKDTSNVTIDSLSWGTNASIFSPSLAPVALGHSLGRGSLKSDSHNTRDWIEIASPTPGR